MISRTTITITIGLVPFALACGGSAPPAGATTPPSHEAASSRTSSGQALLRLGHYSSGDGMVGFVLDRSGPAPKVRIDGTSEVLTLEVQRTGAHSMDLVNHDKHLGIGVDDDGRVVFSQKGAGANKVMFLDGVADPL